MSTNILNLTYKVKLSIPFGQLQSVLDWCNKNCSGDWNYTDIKGYIDHTNTDNHWRLTLDYVFSFESELDHLAFILVYC
jgi:hypothetical protein